MRKLLGIVAVSFVACFVSGCLAVTTPAQGILYTDVDWGATATSAAKGSKVGKSSAVSIMALVATGDASIEAAKKNGGITTVSHVDYHTTSILGLYGQIQCIVYGD